MTVPPKFPIPPNSATDRTAKDYAIEFGGYLATAAERFLDSVNTASGIDDIDDGRALARAIYEFRKRAAKA